MFDLLSEIRQTLRANRLRTILTGIAVAWGIFMLIVLLGSARGVRNGFEYNSAGNNNNTINIWGGRTSRPYHGYRDGREIQLRNSDAGALSHDVGHFISGVVPYAENDTARLYSSSDYVSASLQAIYPQAIDGLGNRFRITDGRFINEHDIELRRRSIVIEENRARELFGDTAQAVGRTVRCMNLAWTVVGVYSHGWRQNSYVPYTTYDAVTGFIDRPSQLRATIQNMTTTEDADRAERAIRATLARTHQFHPEDDSALWIWNTLTSYLASQTAMKVLDLTGWIIGLLTLLTGIVGVSNIMFVSVRERTHEIGIRRAIGARPRSILTQIIAESVAVTTIFGYIGIFAGMVVTQIMDVLFGASREFRNPTVDISIALEVTLALIIAGAVAGLFPALKAIKVKPVEALREE